MTTVHTPILVDRYLLINDEIRITESHPMLSGGEWSAARDLRVGDNLTAPDGSVVPIVSIRQVNQMTLVYTFETSSKNYIAHGVVVHNKENCLKYAYDGP